MAEQEIAQHSKNIIELVTTKQHTLAHRLREIAIEIVTIVFAVSMSIWLHGLSEHHHQQQEVRHFLIGLRSDLKSDIATLNEMKGAHHEFDANYVYLAGLQPGAAPDGEKFDKAYMLADANWFFNPRKNRFDGFTMSGKFSNIEDEALLDAILNLYQTVLPQVRTSEHGWQSNQEQLRAYRDAALSTDDAEDHYRIYTAPKGKRLLRQMVTFPQLYDRYQQYVDHATQIVAMIDAAYPDAAGAKAQ